MMMKRAFCLCGEAAGWFLFVLAAALICNRAPGGVTVVRHGVDVGPAATLVAAAPDISLWRVAAVALVAVAASRLRWLAASAIPGPEGVRGPSTAPDSVRTGDPPKAGG